MPDQQLIAYKCETCNFLLTQTKDEPAPSYCPMCAVNQLKGVMALVENAAENGPESRS